MFGLSLLFFKPKSGYSYATEAGGGLFFLSRTRTTNCLKQNCTPGKTLYDGCNLCLCSEQSKWVGACMTDNCTCYGLGDEEILGAYKHDHQ
uniref:Pacifastin domain-containing protein n=1 Tax=Timema poppense TaxID=170557 RepID=A0A7R9D1U9_TIMPO|nr:unnamed protein product [Timema poppensis]